MSARSRPADCCDPPLPPPALPTAERRRLAAAFKALADPTRLEIFRLIAAQHAPVCACDLVGLVAVGQPTISHHLKVLRQAGLITLSRRGVWAHYAVDPHGLTPLRGALHDLVPPPPIAPASRA